ncbi:MAG TPA: hypothetical protein VJ891_11265 [Casimicrobiaceae bacterium]|nr:hypothetical protein [Casimicrobiaceae bacterium]
MLRGPNILISDEFTGDTLNRGLWANNSSVSVIDDYLNGGFGVAQITNNGSVGGILATFAALVVGISDFRLRARLRIPNYLTLSGTYDAYFGLGLSTGALLFHFKRTTTQTFNVEVLVGSDVDTGVAVPVTSYAEFEIRRESGVASFLINDVVVYSIASGNITTGYTPAISTTYENSNSFTIYVDYFKIYFERQAISSALGAQALGVHAEAQTIQFANTDTAIVTWNVPFADTSYRMPEPGVLVTSGGGVVSVSIQSKTTTGVTLKASDVFTGEAYVEAHE